MSVARTFSIALCLVGAGCTGELAGGRAGGQGDDDTTSPRGTPRTPAGSSMGAPGTPVTPGGATPGTNAAGCGFAPARLWRLSPTQLGAVITGLFPGVDGDEAAEALQSTFLRDEGAFTNRATLKQLPENHVTALMQQARSLADQGLTSLSAAYPCLAKPAGADDEACVSSFLATFARKAFRGPLSDEETGAYLAFYRAEKTARGGKDALAQVIAAVLLSPRFLFRTELGEGSAPGTFRLTPHETASLLAAFLQDGPPDTALMTAADRGELTTRDQLAAHARRLLGEPASTRGVIRFFAEHFESRQVAEATKDPAVFPKFDGKLLKEMPTESALFVEEVLFRGDGTLRSLLTANVSFVTRGLADLYGVGAQIPAGTTGYRKVTLPSAERGGLLTQGAFLAHVAHPDATDIVRRGKFVRERLLCQELPPPPMDADVNPIPRSADKQQREILLQHSSDPKCVACHASMDPIGLTFERYDGTGAWRTTEAGRPIDSAGVIENVDGKALRVDSALDLLKALGDSAEVRGCVLGALYEYAHGRPPGAGDACALEAARKAFDASGGDVREAIVSIVSHDAFVTRVR